MYYLCVDPESQEAQRLNWMWQFLVFDDDDDDDDIKLK
jgi:hypothetical protein